MTWNTGSAPKDGWYWCVDFDLPNGLRQDTPIPCFLTAPMTLDTCRNGETVVETNATIEIPGVEDEDFYFMDPPDEVFSETLKKYEGMRWMGPMEVPGP